MAELKSKNPYDDLLTRSEEAVPGNPKEWKTVTHKVWEDAADGRWRIRIIIANPEPFKFFIGYDIETPSGGIYLVPGKEKNYATNERHAMLYALGRIQANLDLTQEQEHAVKKEIFNQRQLTLF